jgi:hypothetical protein
MSAAKTNDTALNGQNNSEAELVCWPYAPGVCRFQTSSPEIAKKLSQRSRARLVGWSVHGGYLRIFEERIEPWRAQQLVTRYLTPTNGAFSSPISSPSRQKVGAGTATAADCK